MRDRKEVKNRADYKQLSAALGARKRTNNKLNPHMTPRSGIKPGTQWWEASAVTTEPCLHPIKMTWVLERTKNP